MEYFLLEKQSLKSLMEVLQKEYRVFLPRKEDRLHKDNKNLNWKEYDGNTKDVVISEYRTAEPLKNFFFSSSEIVARGFKSKDPLEGQKPYAIIGAKACDLNALKITDYVFSQEPFQDPFYLEKRNKNLIISADCTSSCETCFCTALDNKPYPEKSFDINLSESEKIFIVEIGSDKGRKIVEKNTNLFRKISEDVAGKRSMSRDKVATLVDENVKKYNIPLRQKLSGAVKKGYDSKIWENEALTCVECGACNFICPTCHCFYLSDVKIDKENMRYKLWDACLYKDFARVAGGANPRKKLPTRLRNRYEKKFDYFPEVMKEYACTGCGRCIACCPAKIDIRRVLKNLVAET